MKSPWPNKVTRTTSQWSLRTSWSRGGGRKWWLKRQRSLLSFQQAIGGSLAKSVHMADNDFDPDNDPLTVSKSSSIRVPSLEEIVIPQDLAEQHPGTLWHSYHPGTFWTSFHPGTFKPSFCPGTSDSRLWSIPSCTSTQEKCWWRYFLLCWWRTS